MMTSPGSPVPELDRSACAARPRKRFKLSARQALSGMFLFFCFFPYLALAPSSTDLQPYAFIFSIVVCLTGWRRLPRPLQLLALPALMAFVLWMLDLSSFFAFRGFVSYLSLLSISAATYFVLRRRGGEELLRFFIVFSTCAWVAAALLETLVNPAIFSLLIPNISLDADRGVTGLATEPSFYGIYCLFLMGLNYVCNGNNKLIAGLLIFQIALLAKSTIALLLLVILFLYWSILFLSRKTLALSLLAVAAIYLLAEYVLPQFSELRVASLAADVVRDPLALLQVDVSINARIGHSLFSLTGFLDNFGWPHGFDHFHEYVTNKLNDSDYVWLGLLEPGLKIMSGYGAAMFELGWAGLAVPVAITLALSRFFRGRPKLFLLATLYVHTIMFAAIQLSLPILGVTLGYLAWASKTRPLPSPRHQELIRPPSPC